MNMSDWIALGELIIAIIGVVVGFIGTKELHEANKIKIKFNDLNAKIDKIEVNNSQMANAINNNGIGLKDAEYVADKIAEEKAKDRPREIISDTEPDSQDCDYWVKPRKDE